MSAVLFTAGVLVFAVALIVSVALHEAGHMVAAKTLGLHVSQYFVGFGRKIFSFERGGTEYGMRALPLGGYVSIHDGDAQDPEDEEAMLLVHVAPWKRQLVFLAGPAVNIVLGFVILVSCYMMMPVPTPTTTIEHVAPDSPATAAGLHPHDKIIKVNGHPITQSSQVPEHMQPLNQITVERDGRQTAVTVPSRLNNGKPVIGVQLRAVTRHLSAGEAVQLVGQNFERQVMGIVHLPEQIPNLVSSIFGGHRNPDSPSSIIGAGRVSGQVAANSELPTDSKGLYLMSLIGSVNIGLGFFNLLPFLPLDGGRMAVAFIDSINMRVSRFRKKDYRPVGVAPIQKITGIAFVALLAFGLLVITADVVNPLSPL